MTDYIKSICENEAFTYTDYLLANHCMPTLLKSKPSNLVTVSKKHLPNKEEFFTQIEKVIGQFDCSYHLLYEDQSIYLLMIYDLELLGKVLEMEENRAVLSYYGYLMNTQNVMNFLTQLQCRYRHYRGQGSDFPHELGIFLGYPKKDVEEYIRNHGTNYLFCGVWKVYHDVEQALKIFDYYHRVREDAIDCLNNGGKLIELKRSYMDYGKPQATY